VIEAGKVCRRIRGVIQQRGHDDMDLGVRRHHANQAHRGGGGRALIVGGIARRRTRQCHDLLWQARGEEGTHGLETVRAIAADAERNAACRQCADQPAGRKAAIEQQKIVRTQHLDGLEQHLTFIAYRFMQSKIEKQLAAGQKQAERHALDDGPHLVDYHRQAHLAAIGRHQAQAAPARQGQILLNQRHQALVDIDEYQGTDLVTRLRERLSRNDPDRIGAVSEIGEEAVEFGLDGALQAGQQEGEHGGERQRPLAGEEFRLEAR
jgi:hypothetical protein